MLNLTDQNIILPYLDVSHACPEHKALYLRFMGHLRHVPVSRAEIKILSSIQFTADMTDNSDAYVSNFLVDIGLRAPRLAFPNAFLDFADRALMRRGWRVGAPGVALEELQSYWLGHSSSQDDNKKSDFRRIHNVVCEDVLA